MERLWSPWRLAYVTGAAGDARPAASSATRACRRRPSSDVSSLVRGRRCLRHPQPLSLQQRPPDGGAQPPRRDARGARPATSWRELMRLTRDAEMALTEAYHAAGHQRRHQPRPAGRRRHRRPPARAPGAALERRHQLHVGRRRDARAARGAARRRRQRLRPIFERLADGNDVATKHEARSRRSADHSLESCIRDHVQCSA